MNTSKNKADTTKYSAMKSRLKKPFALLLGSTFVLSSFVAIDAVDKSGGVLPNQVSAEGFFTASEWRNAYRNVPSWVNRSLWGGSALVPQWVDTSRWRARVTQVHTCSQRNFVRVDTEEGFSVDQNPLNNAQLLERWRNGNLSSSTIDNTVNRWFTDNRFTSDASQTVQISDGLGQPIRGKVFAPVSSGAQTTPFGNLINQVNNTDTWDGRPTQLRQAALNAIEATRNWTSNFYLTTAQRQTIAEGGVLNVNQTKTRASVASSRNITEHIERRDYECGFDFQRRNASGNVTSSGTYWFLNATQRREIADPFHPRQVNEHNVAQGRHNAIVNNFAFTDYGHGSSFAVQWSNQVMRYGVQEAYTSAFCGYENSYNRVRVNSGFRDQLIAANLYVFPAGYELNARQRLPIWEANSVSCNISSTGQGRRVSSPHFSHQQPFNELGSILWSYRHWDRQTGMYHSTHQNREGLGPTIGIDGSRIGGNMIWVNTATPRIEGAFNARETRFQEEVYGQIDGIADAQTSALPAESYQVMNAVCNVDGMNNVLGNLTGSARNYTVQDEQEYSKLVVSRTYNGTSIPSRPDFGRNSGNDSGTTDFYTKECDFPTDQVSTPTHAANNPSNASEGFESFGAGSEGTNSIVKMRDNVASTVRLSVDERPDVDANQISNTRPAYTLFTKAPGGSLGDMLNLTTSDRQHMFRGNSSGRLSLTNEAIPQEYSSSSMELIHGFVNGFQVSSPWVTAAGNPEAINVSYAWRADLRAPVPFFVTSGSNSSSDRIGTTGTTVVPVIGRSHVEMGGSGNPSRIADIAATSGTSVDVSNVDPSDVTPDASNSLVFEFVRTVSER